MHTLHTTPAIVLGSYEHGESSRVYRLFTREFGLLYVHAQGVRALKNRNRFALTSFGHMHVTLVRGRETWRLTSAHAGAASGPIAWRRVVTLAGRLLPRDDPAPEVFDALVTAADLEVGIVDEALRATYEAQLALAVLLHLGYVALPVVRSEDIVLPPSTIADVRAAHPHRATLVRAVNTALAELPREHLTPFH